MILLPPSLPHDLPIPFNQWVATELHETPKKQPKTSYVWPFVHACLFVPWVVLHKFVFFHRITWTAHGSICSTGRTKKTKDFFPPPHVLQSHNKFKPITFQKRGQEFYWWHSFEHWKQSVPYFIQPLTRLVVVKSHSKSTRKTLKKP